MRIFRDTDNGHTLHDDMLKNEASPQVMAHIFFESPEKQYLQKRLIAVNPHNKTAVICEMSFKTCGHTIIDREDELHKLQKSKYMQSNVDRIYNKVKDALVSGQKVLFSGCPCQVAALYKITGEHDNLFTIDLLCGHSPSQLFFQKYIDETYKGKKLDFY